MDAVKLLDLQLQLVQIDLGEFWGRSRVAIALIAISGAALIAALPVGLFGIAELVRQRVGLSPEFALLAVSATVVIAALAGVWSGLRGFEEAAVPLKRSGEELRENLKWLRQLLHSDSDAG